MGQWLYRKNNNEVPTRWRAGITDNGLIIEVEYGIVGKASRFEAYKVTQKNAAAELESRYKDKRKTGYMSIEDIKDDGDISRSPVEGGDINSLYQYLAAYLPKYRTNENNGGLLPMLAKSYTGKVWDKVPVMIGQYKINGLRCFISAEYNNGDMFKPIKLRFQSREGIYWSTLSNLEEYLLTVLPEDLITAMIEEQWSLDGEIYLPGYTVNQINHFVKDANCVENKALQFWCYDLAVPEMSQSNRLVLIDKYLDNRITSFHDYKEHLNNNKRLIRLPSIFITNDNEALKYRDEFIGLGFEGLILRNPSADYQYGRRRVGYMEKFKSATDGKFLIVDIYKEPKRDLPIILCQNDVNTAKFETRLSATHEYQQMILRDKHLYIGKYLFVEFGERSGVEKVPMHVKKVEIKI
ncbi:ATP-dependent DNA ligase [uncultured phage cr91_1]|uniref:ATP-dependent DNA ligase n=1 Tax=uncultured phage cr91_1 TaxID=2986403 RepID=A0AAE7V2C8_9CAUD|nr:ATP-dependent DNA ligase [uncultured phage cr91_1]QWM89589.1 ATP-dependent DNA ligase [uncultured phage cr91_1]